jgi:mitogen-activated protein kinase kinase 3
VPNIPRDLDSSTTITIDDQTFDIEADDLESICVLGRGAYGVVEKMKHIQTSTILAVKVSSSLHLLC